MPRFYNNEDSDFEDDEEEHEHEHDCENCDNRNSCDNADIDKEDRIRSVKITCDETLDAYNEGKIKKDDMIKKMTLLSKLLLKLEE